jgi:hypothetical protein
MQNQCDKAVRNMYIHVSKVFQIFVKSNIEKNKHQKNVYIKFSMHDMFLR